MTPATNSSFLSLSICSERLNVALAQNRHVKRAPTPPRTFPRWLKQWPHDSACFELLRGGYCEVHCPIECSCGRGKHVILNKVEPRDNLPALCASVPARVRQESWDESKTNFVFSLCNFCAITRLEKLVTFIFLLVQISRNNSNANACYAGYGITKGLGTGKICLL